MCRNLALATLATCAALLVSSGVARAADKVHPALRAKMLASDPGTFLSVEIVLDTQFDAAGFQRQHRRMERHAKRQELVRQNVAFAAKAQARLRAYLQEQKEAGRVHRLEPLWITNSIWVETQPAVIDTVAGYSEVLEIRWNAPIPESWVTDDRWEAGVPQTADGEPSWSMTKISAPLVWAMGYTGQGIVLSNVDSGTDMTHNDLKDHIWANPGEIPDNGIDDDGNGKIDDTWGWNWDFNNNNPSPNGTHGTNTAGIAVGDGTNGIQTGVAPDALLMVHRIASAGEVGQRAASQYSIAEGADVITSSHSWKWYFSPRPAYHLFRQVGEQELAGDLIHTNSTSNDGNTVGIPWNVSAPGNDPPSWIHPDQPIHAGVAGGLGSGGVNQNDSHYSPSPWGPSAWEDIKLYDPFYTQFQDPNYWDYPWIHGNPGLMKPDIASPTGGITTTTSGNNYTFTFSGTSAATPHAGGTAALIRSINPAIPSSKICQAILMNGRDLGAPGYDNLFGAGHLEAYEAAINLFTRLDADTLTPPPGGSVTLDMEGPAGAAYLLFMSPNLGTTNVGGIFTMDLAGPFLILDSGAYDGSGMASFTFPIPNMPALDGIPLHWQTITDDVTGSTGLILVSLHETTTITI